MSSYICKKFFITKKERCLTMNCHGHETRVKIVNRYDLKCIAHIKLLNGQTIHSDAGGNIIDKYYIFECRRKGSSLVDETILCGNVAAKDFFQLANISAPPVFNMLREPEVDNRNGLAGSTHDGSIKHDIWNDAAKQLHNAIMILIVAWQLRPGKMYEYLEEAKKYKYCVPYADRVDRINQIFHHHNTSLRAIINNLAINNNIRNYRFNLLEDILHENSRISYFEEIEGR